MKKLLLSIAFGLSLMAQAQEGTLDATFATAGVFKTEGNYSSSGITTLADGKFLICGAKSDANGTDFGVFKHNSDGSIDNTFGTNGAVLIDFFGKQDLGNSIAILADGKILVTGIIIEGSTKKYALAKLNADGTLDNTFGTSGKVVTAIPGASSLGLGSSLVTSNKIILAGSGGGASPAAIVVYNIDGTLDNNFSLDGILTPNNLTDINAIAVQADGKILVSGPSGNNAAIARFNADGTSDNSFATNGKYTNSELIFGFATTYIDLQTDGKIVCAFGSFATAEIKMLRLNTNGTLDTDFGTAGNFSFNVFSNNDFPKKLKVQSNGKALIIGSAYANTSNTDLFIARVNSNGTLDATFGTNGITITSVRADAEDNAADLSIQADGKILVAGNQCGGSCNYFALRYNANKVSSTGLNTETEVTFSLYPNPASSVLNLTLLNSQQIARATITDLFGKMVNQETIVTNNPSLNIENLTKGIYFLTIETEEGTSTQKFIKQ